MLCDKNKNHHSRLCFNRQTAARKHKTQKYLIMKHILSLHRRLSGGHVWSVKAPLTLNYLLYFVFFVHIENID